MQELSDPNFRNSMIDVISSMIIKSKDDRSVRQHAEQVLDDFITRTNRHIWLVNQCAGILKDCLIEHGQDAEEFLVNVEYHDYDKLHDAEVIPVYALGSDVFYFAKEKLPYEVDKDHLLKLFKERAFPKHRTTNSHHAAEHFGKLEGETWVVPELNNWLILGEMVADWMAMGITHGDTARDWWNKTNQKRWKFSSVDTDIIEELLTVEDNANNQLAYLRQFKVVEPSWVPPTEIHSDIDANHLENKASKEAIDSFFEVYQESEIGIESLTTKRDDLYIGPIDPMTLDFDKVYELAKYPNLLFALKSWGTKPDRDLMPQLQELGKIVDGLYKFSKPIPCYRGIRTGFSTRPAQNLMGTIDDKLRMFRMLNPEYKAGYRFEFETPEPMSVTRAVFLAKVYGNFIVKCELTKDVNKLVITPELSYLLQQMDIDYPQYRPVNLSTTHECIIFPGQKLTYTVVSTYGDISNELGTMDQSAFESLGYIPIESSEESLKSYGDFANTSEKRTIKQLVDKYYDKVGSHGWNHISEVLATAEKLVKRSLTLVEYTAVVCHDLARKEMDEGHPARSVEIAKDILPGTNLFSKEELAEIYKAIGAHGNKHEFASELCELVACADRCFPKTTIEDLYERPILWMLEGSDRGKPAEKEYDASDDLSIATRAVSQIKKWCGDIYDKAVKEDNLYTRTFKNDLKKTQDLANTTTPEQVVPLVKKLRSSFKGYSTEALAEKAIKDGLLYHGSCQKYSVLKPQPQKDVDDKRAISLSPYKRIASMFTVPVSEIGKGKYKRRMIRLEDWFEDRKDVDMYAPIKEVHIWHNMKDQPKIDKVCKGYLYTIKAEEALADSSDNPKWKGPDEVLSYVKELHPIKVEETHIRLIAEYNPKKAGVDHDAIPIDKVGTEALDPQWSSPSVIKSHVTQEDIDHLKSLCGEYVYHGSSVKFSKITPTVRKDTPNDPCIAFTPLIGIAELFTVPESHLGKGLYSNKAFRIQSWYEHTNDYDHFKQLNGVVEIHHNIKEYANKTFNHVGYIYCVKTSKIFDQLVPYNRWSKSMECWYFGKEVIPDKILTVNVKVKLVYDLQLVREKGGDAVLISDSSTETYSETATELSGNYNALFDKYMYHGSSIKLSVLKPQIRNNKTTSTTEPKIFFTPFKGFAAIFCIDQNEQLPAIFGSHYDPNTTIIVPKDLPKKDSYGNYELTQFKQIKTNIVYKHNVKQFSTPFSKQFVGYIYSVDKDKLISDGLKEHVFSGIPEYWYFKDVVPDKVEQIRINVVFEYDSTLGAKHSTEAITAKTPDVKRGKISKAHQDLCGKYLYHGTHRNLDIKFLGIHVCKNRANTDIKAPCVYMNRSLGVACLHCVPFMIGHGSKLANYKEHFVNLEEAINSDGKVVNVEIVHNDPKLQECSGSNDGYIYCVKKEDCVNDLYYATPEEPNNWNFVAYKQLPIDKKIHVKVNWHKKYDEDFAKRVASGYAAIESLQLAYEQINNEESSTEALDPKIKEKRKYITDYICAICDLIDPSKLNSKRYHRLLDHMSDKDFDRWMHYVKDGKWKLHIVAPNLIINLKNENLLKAADKAKCKLFHRLWMTDNATGRQYLTDNEYLVLTLSVRRQQQYLDEKLSVPDNDRQIDGMTGQVTGDSRACSMTNPEIQILAARGLDATLEELVNVRGGNINAYAEFKRQAEETGEISLNTIDRGSISRVAMVGQILLQSMMIDNNIVGN